MRSFTEFYNLANEGKPNEPQWKKDKKAERKALVKNPADKKRLFLKLMKKHPGFEPKFSKIK